MVIIPAGDQSSENEISMAVVALLRTCAYGEADFKKLFFELPRYIKLTPIDREVSNSRAAELKWHAIVRNIGAHAGQPGNFITEGILVKRRGGGYQLASKVRRPNDDRRSHAL